MEGQAGIVNILVSKYLILRAFGRFRSLCALGTLKINLSECSSRSITVTIYMHMWYVIFIHMNRNVQLVNAR